MTRREKAMSLAEVNAERERVLERFVAPLAAVKPCAHVVRDARDIRHARLFIPGCGYRGMNALPKQLIP